jgi:pimeloyl-ACP methyl ester carboxylesterase
VEAEAEPPVPIVFLHHFGGSARTWDGVIGHLRAEHRCVAPDLAGFGAAHEAPGPFTAARYADDLAKLLDGIGSERYVIVGHSMGGKIALAFAARRPAGLAGLVLLAPSPPTPEPMTHEDRAATLAGHGDRDAALATLAKITARALSATMAERTVDDMLRSSPEAWAAWLESGSREDIAAEVDGLRCRRSWPSATKTASYRRTSNAPRRCRACGTAVSSRSPGRVISCRSRPSPRWRT